MLHCDRLVVASTRWPFDVAAIHEEGVVGLAHLASPLKVNKVHLSRDTYFLPNLDRETTQS